jgi:hypothetical protein
MNYEKDGIFIYTHQAPGLILHRKSEDEADQVVCFFNFSRADAEFQVPAHLKPLEKLIASSGLTNNGTEENSAKDEELQNKGIIKLKGWGVAIYRTSGHKSNNLKI